MASAEYTGNIAYIELSNEDSDKESASLSCSHPIMSSSQTAMYAPPPYAPNQKPLLPLPSDSKSLPYAINLEYLARDGWASLDMQDIPSDPLYKHFSELFDASSRFLSLPEDEKIQHAVQPSAAFQASEEGYSRVQGEKCMIALRKASTTPKEFDLRRKAEVAWKASAGVMRDILAAIEQSLGMDEGVLVRTTETQLKLPAEKSGNVATLMRMFQYDRPLPPAEAKVVAEHHKDLGLLTIVVGHSPGLECWDTLHQEWISCETREGLNATVLVGQTLAKFTNLRYCAGRHRVFVHPSLSSHPTTQPSNPLSNPLHRYSLVHALRGHFPVSVSHTDFETAITGTFAPHMQFSASIREIYRAISNAHYNVNIGVEERRKQEEAILNRTRDEAEAAKVKLQEEGRSDDKVETASIEV